MQPKNNQIISGTAGLLILIFFFTPWITVSCGGVAVSATGYELASGNLSEAEASGAADDESSGDFYLWVIPIAGLVVLGLVAGTMSNMFSIAEESLGKIFIGVGLVGLAAQILEYIELQSDVNEATQQGIIFSVSYEIGWWITLLALIGIVVSGFLTVRARDAAAIQGATPPPDN